MLKKSGGGWVEDPSFLMEKTVPYLPLGRDGVGRGQSGCLPCLCSSPRLQDLRLH